MSASTSSENLSRGQLNLPMRDPSPSRDTSLLLSRQISGLARHNLGLLVRLLLNATCDATVRLRLVHVQCVAPRKLPCASRTYTTHEADIKARIRTARRPWVVHALVSLECHPIQVEVYLPVPVVSRPPMPPDLFDEVVHAPFEREAADDVALCGERYRRCSDRRLR